MTLIRIHTINDRTEPWTAGPPTRVNVDKIFAIETREMLAGRDHNTGKPYPPSFYTRIVGDGGAKVDLFIDPDEFTRRLDELIHRKPHGSTVARFEPSLEGIATSFEKVAREEQEDADRFERFRLSAPYNES